LSGSGSAPLVIVGRYELLVFDLSRGMSGCKGQRTLIPTKLTLIKLRVP